MESKEDQIKAIMIQHTREVKELGKEDWELANIGDTKTSTWLFSGEEAQAIARDRVVNVKLKRVGIDGSILCTIVPADRDNLPPMLQKLLELDKDYGLK